MARTVVGGWIGVVGAGTFFFGAAIATSVGAWDLSGVQFLRTISQSPLAWRWGNALLALGSAFSATGMLFVASEGATPLTRIGLILWLAAGVSGLMGFILQGECPLIAARMWNETGTIPSWFAMLTRTSGIAIGVFMIVGIIGSIMIGWWLYGLRGLSTALFASGLGVLAIAVIFAVMSIPAAAALTAGWVAVACPVQGAA